MLIFILTLIILVLLISHLRLLKELGHLAAQLEEIGIDSNVSLRTGVRSRPFLRFLKAVNIRLENGLRSHREMISAQQEMKYTITCVSHDIRTPLTGACGYLQLLAGCRDEDKRERYCSVIQSKLRDLETILNELFTYTKLGNEDYPLVMESVSVYPFLCQTIAEFFHGFEEKGTEPEILFEDPDWVILADTAALKRIFGSLTDNYLKHGSGNLCIRRQGNKVFFDNDTHLCTETEKLFDRFYKGDPARRESSTGLGLCIVKQLMDKMNYTIQARQQENLISFCLDFHTQMPEK